MRSITISIPMAFAAPADAAGSDPRPGLRAFGHPARRFSRTTAVAMAVLAVLAHLPAGAQPPTYMWSRTFGNTGDDQGQAVAIDGADNVVMAGWFSLSTDFGGGMLTSAGNADVIVAKYDAAGNHLWSRRFGGTGADEAYEVAVDGAGNVLVTGLFAGTVDFGGGNLVAAGSSDVFLLKLDPSGNHLWSRRFGSSLADMGYGVATDGAGNVLVTGQYVGNADFGGGPLVSAGSTEIFLAKYDAGGAHQWSRRFGNNSTDVGRAVVVDGSGNVILTGYCSGTVDFGGGGTAALGNDDAFVAKFDAAGTHQWSRRFGGVGDDIGYSVAVDGAGAVVATGFFQGTMNAGGGNLVSAGVADIFVAKYDAAGAHQWSRRFGGSGHDVGYGAAMDSGGGVLLTGEILGAVDLGGGPVTGQNMDIFVAKYDPSGNWLWNRHFGGTSTDLGFDVAADGTGGVVLTGYYRLTADFGGGPVTSVGSVDGVLAKYHDDAAVPVLFSRFEAQPASGGGVELDWSVRADAQLAGLRLDRTEDDGAWQPLTPALLPAEATAYRDRTAHSGALYRYRLAAVQADGREVLSAVAEVRALPYVLTLAQNRPNPFNPRTTIRYDLPRAGAVRLAVFDLAGRLVRTLVNESRPQGSHEAVWDGRDVAGREVSSGVYVARLEFGGRVDTVRMELVR